LTTIEWKNEKIQLFEQMELGENQPDEPMIVDGCQPKGEIPDDKVVSFQNFKV